ncbi:MAG: pyruvate phosphate dikinase PEP/pyruvate-binding protein [Cyanothece sp. SIO1E1]|nr:pyruvate phosphate dikinase PEP/pyruvate-binding protein [Cyanothece sp. SIO1E1]
MTLMHVWGALVIFIVCPLLGGLPIINWITRGLTGRQLAQIGTGNISVSAAFYHGGRWVGGLAVLSEALKGIVAVLIARYFFASEPAWELIALAALVMGRYWVGRGAGTTNVFWGYIVHDWITAGLVLLVSGIGFTVFRQRQQGRLSVLILLPIMMALRHPGDGARVGAAIGLSALIAWIYQHIPDDLDLATREGQADTQKIFRFFQGTRAILSLNQPLDASKVGQKAATLSQLRCWGYPVPMGWVLPAGDDHKPLLDLIQSSTQQPVVVRSSAIGEDSAQASAAGQYESLLNITNQAALEQAIVRCLESYDAPAAVQYRQDQGVKKTAMAVLVQQQVQGVFSGVAFSRDPIARQGQTVLVEALPGAATQVVSGQVTPEQYRVEIQERDVTARDATRFTSIEALSADASLPLAGTGQVPSGLIQHVALLARHLESRYQGIPQDIEWSYDGQHLWLLQSRPITTLLPIWTRKIAAEVIPGLIRPLTWSINQPLTCGVWGDIFTVVLGGRAHGLNFADTATLHASHAYFNASLLGQIFRRMGLPPESLEFLTRGAKFSKPALATTLRNVPGLLRLVGRELKLAQAFKRDEQKYFAPALADFADQPVDGLSEVLLLARIDRLLALLKPATYYSILAPLSVAMRQAVLRIKDEALDSGQLPEVASLRSLQTLAADAQPLLTPLDAAVKKSDSLLTALAESSQGRSILAQFDQFLDRYGYLSEVGTDIAVPTWREDPQPVRELFTQLLLHPPAPTQKIARPKHWKTQQVQRRLDLKGRVTVVYSQLLAHLRWSFVALEKTWQTSGLLTTAGDIFYLKFDEIRELVTHPNTALAQHVPQLIAKRRSHLEQDSQLSPIPALIYGNDPVTDMIGADMRFSNHPDHILQGIGASPGQVEGRVRVLLNLQTVPELESDTILVVPYTDSGWAPLLARAVGLIANVGGRLSHGAIVAREYGVPAVMDVTQATQRLRDGQRVRIDGQRGIVEIVD